MIPILPGLLIPENELSFSASRSGGPGGQNVNKVSSKVTLAFNLRESSALSDEQKRKIAGKLATRINKDGVLQVVSQKTRSQDLNRADVIDRFAQLLRRALTPQAPRIKTRVPAVAKRQRVDKKRKHGITKKDRSGKEWDS
jgi:ribosome-associated protein